MKPVLATLALAALVLTAAAAPAGAATATRCNELTGKTKVRTATIKVVEVKVRDKRLRGKRLFGCVLPRGKVFKVAESGVPRSGPLAGNVNQLSYTLGINAGRYVEIERVYGDGIALAATEYKEIVDLRTGKRRRFYLGGFSEGACGGQDLESSSDRTPPVQRLVLSRSGAFAVHYANTQSPEECYPNDGQALLRGFPVSGRPVQLDLAPMADIPKESLAIDGSTVSWTNAGQARTRDLATR